MNTLQTRSTRPANTSKRRKTAPWPHRLAVLPALLIACAASAAATRPYVGPNNGNWTTPAHWNGGLMPTQGDYALLGTVAPAGASSLNVNFNAIYDIYSGPTGVTLNASALSGFLTVSQSSAASVLYTGYLEIGTTASRNIYSQSAGNVFADAVIVGNGSSQNFYKLAGGALETSSLQVGLKGEGTFNQTGGSVILQRQSAFDAAGVELGGHGTGTYNLSAGTLKADYMMIGMDGAGTFNQTGGSVDSGPVMVGLANGASGLLNLSGGSFSAGVQIARTGVVNLNKGGSLSGYLSIEGGVFNHQGGSSAGALGVTLNNAAAANGGQAGYLRLLGHDLTLAALDGTGGVLESAGGLAVLTIANDTNASFSGLIRDGAASKLSIVKSGAFTQSLGGANAYTGATSLWGGVLRAESDTAIPQASDVVINIGTLEANGHQLSFSTLSGLGGTLDVGSGAVTVGSAASGTSYYGQLKGGGAFNKTGGGDLALLGGGGFTGALNVTGGSLRVGAVDGIATGSTLNLASPGTALHIDNNQSLAGLSAVSGSALNFNNGSQLTVGSGGADSSFNGNVNGAGTLAKAGTGNLTLGAGFKDTLNGNTNGDVAFVVNAGTLVLNKAAGVNAVGGALGINGGSVSWSRSNQVADRSVATLTGGVLDLKGFDETIGGLAGTGGQVALGGGTLTVAAGEAHSFAGMLAGLGTFVKAGLADATLSNVGGFLGTFAANAGRLILQGPLNATGYKANSGGTLRFDGSTVALNAASINAATGGGAEYRGATVNNGFLRGPGTHTVLAGDASSTFNAVTTFNSTALVQAGNATFNNFSNGGKFTNNALATINGGSNTASGVIQVNNKLNTVDFTSSGVITVNADGALANSGGSLVLGGGSRTTINPGGSLSTEAGSTIELNGALLVNNGVMKGWTNVNFGSVAKGSGIFGIVNVTEGGRFSPGNSPGLATVGGLYFGAGGSYQFEVNDANGAPGKGFDFINNLGELTFAALPTPGNRFRFEIDSLTLANTPGLALNFDASVSRDFTLVHSAEGITGFDPLAIDIDTTGFYNPTQGGSFSIVANGQDLLLHFQAAAVPEPGRVSLLLAGMGMMGWRLRRVRAARA